MSLSLAMLCSDGYCGGSEASKEASHPFESKSPLAADAGTVRGAAFWAIAPLAMASANVAGTRGRKRAPMARRRYDLARGKRSTPYSHPVQSAASGAILGMALADKRRSEERRVGDEWFSRCRSRR